MSGIELVRELRRAPAARLVTCVLVDAEADAARVREAMRLGLAAYLTRPLSIDVLGQRLKKLTFAHPGVPIDEPVIDVSDYLERIKNENEGAPLLGDVQTALTQCVRAADLDLADLEMLFGREPQITARLISAANSAAQFQGMPCLSLAQALPRLGVRRAFNLVLYLTIQRTALLADPRLAKSAQATTEAAQHAATIASWLAQKLKLNREACYTAGLLQNIGELALLRALQGWLDDGGVLGDEALAQLVAERAASFGSALRARWRLPLELRRLIAAYYALESGVYSPEALVMHLTRQITELPTGADPTSLLEHRTARMLSLTPELLECVTRIHPRSCAVRFG